LHGLDGLAAAQGEILCAQQDLKRQLTTLEENMVAEFKLIQSALEEHKMDGFFEKLNTMQQLLHEMNRGIARGNTQLLMNKAREVASAALNVQSSAKTQLGKTEPGTSLDRLPWLAFLVHSTLIRADARILLNEDKELVEKSSQRATPCCSRRRGPVERHLPVRKRRCQRSKSGELGFTAGFPRHQDAADFEGGFQNVGASKGADAKIAHICVPGWLGRPQATLFQHERNPFCVIRGQDLASRA